MITNHRSSLTFGIYPGSAVGNSELSGPPDRPERINQALDQFGLMTGDYCCGSRGRAPRPATLTWTASARPWRNSTGSSPLRLESRSPRCPPA
jgi:hypothetical protein